MNEYLTGGGVAGNSESSALSAKEQSLVPSRPLDSEEQSVKLQRMGLDFLSSVHWVVIIVVALLFAAFVVILKRRRAAECTVQTAEADQLIERGREALETAYFLPDGRLNTSIFAVKKTPSSSAQSSAEESFAHDAINERINSATSQKILPQLRRYVKSGKLFSFFNSMASANDKLQERLQKRRAANAPPPTAVDMEEAVAHSLRSRFGNDRLRNPLIDFQINEEIKFRREREREQEQATKQQRQLKQPQADRQLGLQNSAQCIGDTVASANVGHERSQRLQQLTERQVAALNAAFT